jgi:hypothetical protein
MATASPREHGSHEKRPVNRAIRSTVRRPTRRSGVTHPVLGRRTNAPGQYVVVKKSIFAFGGQPSARTWRSTHDETAGFGGFG